MPKEMKLDVESRSKKLTPKQNIFVAEYLVDLNATQAAIRAGYSKKTAGQIGDENLRKPQIAKVIQGSMSQRAERTEINSELVVQGILRVIRRCEGEGEAFEATQVLKGYELLGKHLGLFGGKSESVAGMIVNVVTGVPRLAE